jgi:hypothetical protein
MGEWSGAGARAEPNSRATTFGVGLDVGSTGCHAVLLSRHASGTAAATRYAMLFYASLCFSMLSPVDTPGDLLRQHEVESV